jgi:hypothetical protein
MAKSSWIVPMAFGFALTSLTASASESDGWYAEDLSAYGFPRPVTYEPTAPKHVDTPKSVADPGTVQGLRLMYRSDGLGDYTDDFAKYEGSDFKIAASHVMR